MNDYAYDEADRRIAEALEPKPTVIPTSEAGCPYSLLRMWESYNAFTGCGEWQPRRFHEDREAAMDALEQTGWCYIIYCDVYESYKIYRVRLEPPASSFAGIIYQQSIDLAEAIGKALYALSMSKPGLQWPCRHQDARPGHCPLEEKGD